MIRVLLSVVLNMVVSASLVAQNAVVFNKTGHDFGTIGQSDVPFEQDFLFRNTGANTVQILSVRAVSGALGFIHTRSEVFKGEYGFVKVKLRTDSLNGLFHDEVYITMRVGSEVVAEVLYLRASVSETGNANQHREFRDSEVATSVEVLPSDIESLEGFGAQDRLASAEAEIGYLKKQLGLKSDLIARLSDDLRTKQTHEEENLQRLRDLEQAVKTKDSADNQAILTQINELTQRLAAMQEADQHLREEVFKQEEQFNQLRHEADSARAYAQSLSQKLQEQFKAEAQAMELAKRLEKDLESKRKTEEAQQEKIDSLQNAIAAASTSGAEAEKLKTELDVRLKEQQLQTEHAQRQHQKIETLKKEREQLAAQTDSLGHSLEAQRRENTALQAQLTNTEKRIKNYEQQIDSLAAIAATQASLDSLQQALAALQTEDTRLKQTIADKDAELATLQNERAEKEKNLRTLEATAGRQAQETQSLTQRINTLSEKETQARMEIAALQSELNMSRTKAITYKSQASELEKGLSHAKLSNEAAFSELNESISDIVAERDEYRAKHEAALREITRLNAALAQSNTERNNAKMALNELVSPAATAQTSKTDRVSYKVNLVASKTKLSTPPHHPTHGKVVEFNENGTFNYAIGDFTTFKEAIALKETMKPLGYPTAHIICFRGNQRISLKEALETASVE